MSTILIGVDDSTQSEDAVAFGRRLAGATGGRVVLAAAFPYNDQPSRSANLQYRQALKEQAEATVRRLHRSLELPGDRVTELVRADLSAARALHELAEDQHAALVVVGHTRHGAAGRLLPGATAERLLHGAPCPVAIVPHDYRHRPESPPRRVGVAYIDTPEGRAALAAAAVVARAVRARLEVISVVSDEVVGGVASTEEHAEIAAGVLAGLEEVVNALRSDVWAEAVRLEGDPAKQLAAHTDGLDLLVMGSRGYGPLRAVLAGGVSGRVSRDASCPVIVVPRGVAAPLADLFEAAVPA